MPYHLLHNAAAWNAVSPPTQRCCRSAVSPTQCCCPKCRITSYAMLLPKCRITYTMLLPEVPYHILRNAAAWNAVSPPTQCCCLKCHITSYIRLLPEVPYHLLHNAAARSAVSPPTQCCCQKCRITSYTALLPEVSYHLHNAAARSAVSPPTQCCCLKCRFASHHGANLPVVVFLHNTKQTCIQRDCFGRLGSECHSRAHSSNCGQPLCFKNSEHADPSLGVVTYREGCKLHKLMVFQNRKTQWSFCRIKEVGDLEYRKRRSSLSYIRRLK